MSKWVIDAITRNYINVHDAETGRTKCFDGGGGKIDNWNMTGGTMIITCDGMTRTIDMETENIIGMA